MKTRNKSGISLSVLFLAFLLFSFYFSTSIVQYVGTLESDPNALVGLEADQGFTVATVIQFVVEMVAYSF